MNNSLNIICAGDLHLDPPLEYLSGEKAAIRRAELRRIPGQITGICRERGAELLLLTGDIFDSDFIYAETMTALYEALENASIPVLISPGNHDPYNQGSVYYRFKFPKNVYIFNKTEISCVYLEELGVRVWGAGFSDGLCPGLLEDFSFERDDDIFDIMCIHGQLTGPSRQSDYNPITETDIAQSGMDFIALGHQHSYTKARAGTTHYAYPGCPAGHGFDELGEKGIIGLVLGRESCDIDFLPLAGRRMERCEIHISDQPALDTINAALPDDTSSHLYKIILKGSGSSAPDINWLKSELSGRFFHLELQDETQRSRDIWEESGQDSLRGIFISQLREMYDSAQGQREREKIMMAAKAGLAALLNSESPFNP